jgi:hypothetical protein
LYSDERSFLQFITPKTIRIIEYKLTDRKNHFLA